MNKRLIVLANYLRKVGLELESDQIAKLAQEEEIERTEESLREQIIRVGKEIHSTYSFLNCRLFVQLVSGVSELEALPVISGEPQPGDIIQWGSDPAQHWAFYIGNNDLLEISEWGDGVGIQKINEVNEEYDNPTAIRRPTWDSPVSDQIAKLASDDKYIVAATLFEEARNQGEDGIKAVYHVILNRASQSGRGVSDICLEKSQFSCWNNKTPYDKDYRKQTGEDLRAWGAIQNIINSPGPDITYGSTHYYTGKAPFWSTGPCWIFRTKVGAHTFGIDMSVIRNISSLPNDIRELYPEGRAVKCQPKKESTWPKKAQPIKRMDRLQKYAASRKEIKNLKDWLSSSESSLSFDDLFDGKFRVVIPFNTKEQRELIKIISFLQKNGWEPAGGNNFFDVKKVKQKLRKLDTGEEYEEEVEVADLKVSKKEKRIIPSGPRKGEEILATSVSTISKVLSNPKNNTPDWMYKWWQGKQSEYVTNYNWNQIESIFKEGSPSSEHSIVISRDPVDVLRMSDHTNITSCHSEGNSYFECAVSESRGNGLVAYLVQTDELNRLLTPDEWDPETGKEPIKREIGDLDGQEIFTDSQRGVEGIEPKSRIRLRKYVNIELDYEFAVPEHRTYGPHPPGFKDLIRRWAWEQQKHLFELDEDGDLAILGISDLEMHGGSYRDSSDGEILNSFFSEGGIDSGFYGNAETVSENEEDVAAMWEAEIDEINEHAGTELKHVFFHAEVGVLDENQPYVSVSVSMDCEIPLSGWDEVYLEDKYAKTNSDFKDMPIGWHWSAEHEQFKNLIIHSEAENIEEVSVDEESKQLRFRIYFGCEDCHNPDDISSHLDWIKADIDGNYNEYIEKVRKNLISEGYIGEIEFDRAAERLSSMSFNNFDVFGGDEDDYDGEILVLSKPDSIPINLKIPDIIMTKFNLLKNTIPEIFNVDKSWSGIYRLRDETLIAIDVLDKIAKESHEFALFSEAINNLEIKISIANNMVATMTIGVRLISGSLPGIPWQTQDSDEHLLFLEQFVHILDKNLFAMVKPIIQSLTNKIQVAEAKANAGSQSFFNGDLARPIIQNLKGFSQPDVKRLVLWIESNWNNFSNAEREVAYYQYLIPTERSGDYVHKDDLNAPRYWDSYMQQRPDTDISYRWAGPSIKDVMPYTDPDAPIGSGLADKEPYAEDKLASLSSWFKLNGFKKEAQAISKLTE